MDLPSAVSNVDSTLTRVTQTPSEIRSDRLLVAYSIYVYIYMYCVMLRVNDNVTESILMAAEQRRRSVQL